MCKLGDLSHATTCYNSLDRTKKSNERLNNHVFENMKFISNDGFKLT